ncbi:hypothetical protein GRS48_13790 [Halorubrum sp. JWXQ-INN 858]|uniref:hypothetical protein n=1 Tax=Halorubrum sp. JWXQ-INN 858 TaxID=2690782 RepID=UPI0013574109|nr:hypothetical protein [Halorubrum sp. JWXQ-INN 858]MWV65884.1 hypothetical protein [Halorubrum sp. JWXQ-INN 858]
MNRRGLLLAAGTVALAGCVGRGDAVAGSAVGADADEGAVDVGGNDDDPAANWDSTGGQDGGDDGDGGDGGDSGEDRDPRDDGSEHGSTPRSGAVDVELVEREPTVDPGTVAVEFDADAVHVDGTVIGASGCHSARVSTAGPTDDGGFRVVVAAVDDAGPDQLCTQAFTALGYEVAATFDGPTPDRVTVVHDDADGRGAASVSEADADGGEAVLADVIAPAVVPRVDRTGDAI